MIVLFSLVVALVKRLSKFNYAISSSQLKLFQCKIPVKGGRKLRNESLQIQLSCHGHTRRKVT